MVQGAGEPGHRACCKDLDHPPTQTKLYDTVSLDLQPAIMSITIRFPVLSPHEVRLCCLRLPLSVPRRLRNADAL